MRRGAGGAKIYVVPVYLSQQDPPYLESRLGISEIFKIASQSLDDEYTRGTSL